MELVTFKLVMVPKRGPEKTLVSVDAFDHWRGVLVDCVREAAHIQKQKKSK